MEHLYQFMSQLYSVGRSGHPVCQGRAAFVGQFIPQREFMDLFGGFYQVIERTFSGLTSAAMTVFVIA